MLVQGLTELVDVSEQDSGGFRLRALDVRIGLDEAEHAETEPDVQPAYRGKNASTMTCETSTR